MGRIAELEAENRHLNRLLDLIRVAVSAENVERVRCDNPEYVYVVVVEQVRRYAFLDEYGCCRRID